MELSANLLDSPYAVIGQPNEFYAVLNAHGLYSPVRFAIRLSSRVHRHLSELGDGEFSPSEVGVDRIQSFSTYLHETIHWWQHVGTTTGLMLSLNYPAQTHANYGHLRRFVSSSGAKKSVLKYSELNPSAGDPNTREGLATVIVNNYWDLGFFRSIVHGRAGMLEAINHPYFECTGHAFNITYGNNLKIISSTIDPEHIAVPDPAKSSPYFSSLRDSRIENFYYGSPAGIPPIGVMEIYEGQARFSQLQYLYFALKRKLDWEAVKERGLLSGVYGEAFQTFLKFSELEWPKTIDDPAVALFLLICDMSCNPGEGYPFPVQHYKFFVEDTHPGIRFISLCRIVATSYKEAAFIIRKHSRDEYISVSNELASRLKVHPPHDVSNNISNMPNKSPGIEALMEQYKTFAFDEANLPVRVLMSHHIALNADKCRRPEFFCWPGVWMGGGVPRAQDELDLFKKHSALFIDKENDDSIFPILHSGRDPTIVHDTFVKFYTANVLYDATEQWISSSGPFKYNYKWLKESYDEGEMKSWVDQNFKNVYGVAPENFEVL